MNSARVGVVEGSGLSRHVTQYVTFGRHGRSLIKVNLCSVLANRLERARAAMILVHGRGASAADIMTVAAEVMYPGVAYVAPQAAGNALVSKSIHRTARKNEPYLSSALESLSSLLAKVHGSMPYEKIVLLGFSQGACLTLEFAARSARRYGGVIGLSGGLIGPDGTPRDYAGSFDGTPRFLAAAMSIRTSARTGSSRPLRCSSGWART